MNKHVCEGATDSGFRFIDASVRIVRTEVVRRSLILAFPAAIPESDVEAIANLLVCERAEGVDVSRNQTEGYVPDDAATDGFLKMEVLPQGQAEQIDVVLETGPGGTVRVKRRHYFPEIIDPRTWDYR
jgi:hypothetical protein